MKLKIIIPFRPSTGGMNSGGGDFHMNPMYQWVDQNDQYVGQRPGQPERAIDYLNAHSKIYHDIIVAIDGDMHPRADWLSRYPNVTVLKDPYLCGEASSEPFYRSASAIQYAFSQCGDEDWVMEGFNCDAICCRGWDENLDQAFAAYGENYVFIPMWVEIVGTGPNRTVDDSPATPQQIWTDWRKTICCHALTMPHPSKHFVTLPDFEAWCDIARSDRPEYVVEPCGLRDWGYFACMVAKGKHWKACPKRLGPGWETEMDGNLWTHLGLQKVVMTDSFVLHTGFCDYREAQ